jgi:F-type H+-transporting ATPase subunit gamma
MNIRQVRKKIKTIGNVKKITRAMELVSAVKMKKSQQEAVDSRPYRETLEDVIKRIIGLVDVNLSPLLTSTVSEKHLAIIISSNKGLCGSFNFNLFRFCLKNVDFEKTDFIILGKKASFLVNKMGGNIIADFSTGKPQSAISAIFNLVLEKFLSHEYASVSLVYNKFISALQYNPVKETILPANFLSELSVEADDHGQDVKNIREEYLIEPSAKSIVDVLLKSFVEDKIRGAVISNEAGEHSARMMAMRNATENASDIIYEMTLLRNKLRQEKITYELLDMITAKESVENN